MNQEQKEILLKVAKDTVTAAVSGSVYHEQTSDEPELNSNCGCFVTLKNKGLLRGCIGQFISDKALIELVSEMAVASSTRDSRFFADPITKDELEELEIEISVLSPLEKTDDPMSLRLGIDGIYVVKGNRSGCFLPQVATEAGWSKEEYLGYCCSHKAGLRPDAWKDKGTSVYFFSADVFGANFSEI